MLVKLQKHFRLAFSLSTTKTSRVFELIHFDLWHDHVTSTSGFKYYILFLNEFSHFLWVFPLRAKSKVYFVFFAIFIFMLKNNLKLTFSLFSVIIDMNLTTIISSFIFNLMELLFASLVHIHIKKMAMSHDPFTQLIMACTISSFKCTYPLNFSLNLYSLPFTP